jgi:hypothetical protein
MKNFLILLSIVMIPGTALAYDEQRSAPEQSYQKNSGYQQQIDHTSPEGTMGEMSQERGGPGEPHQGPDGTEYPSNNLQDDDPE